MRTSCLIKEAKHSLGKFSCEYQRGCDPVVVFVRNHGGKRQKLSSNSLSRFSQPNRSRVAPSTVGCRDPSDDAGTWPCSLSPGRLSPRQAVPTGHQADCWKLRGHSTFLEVPMGINASLSLSPSERFRNGHFSGGSVVKESTC